MEPLKKKKINLDLDHVLCRPKVRYKCNGMGVCMWKLDAVCGGDQEFEVLRVGAFTWMSLKWFQLAAVVTKKEFLYWSALEWGASEDLEFTATCQCNILRCKVLECVHCWDLLGLATWVRQAKELLRGRPRWRGHSNHAHWHFGCCRQTATQSQQGWARTRCSPRRPRQQQSS